MKQSQGWARVIKFDSLKPINKEELSPEKKAQYTVCTFANEFIDIFNTQPLHARLTEVAKLYMMVNALAIGAFVASIHKLPYVELNRFDTIKDGKPMPLFHMIEEKPN